MYINKCVFQKAPKIIEYAPKSKFKKDVATIDIWRNMTISELAKSMGRDVETIQVIILMLSGHTIIFFP